MKRSIMNTRMMRNKAFYTQAVAKNTILIAGKIFFLTLLLSLLLFAVNAQKLNEHHFNNVNENGVILDGYDPVAFFTDNKPVKGDAKFQYTYNDAIYYFA